MSGVTACGIDFGTSNSTVSVTDKKGKRLVRLEDDKTTLPSAMFFQKGKAPVFGRAAIYAYTEGEEGRFMRGLKKILGTSLMEERTLIGNKSVTFREILKTFLIHLKESAEEHTGGAIDSVVLGRPVHFHDNDAQADRKSESVLEEVAKDAGFKHTAFLFEPIAAAFAHEQNINEEKLSLVVDLGGGTSDFTVIRLSKDKLDKKDRSDDILSTSGVRIGGTTFDARLSLQNFMPELGMGSHYLDIFDKEKRHPMPSGVYFQLSDWALVNFAQTKKSIIETRDILTCTLAPQKLNRLLKLQENHLGHAFLGEVEKTKIALTDHTEYAARFDDLDFNLNLSRQDFETSIAQDVDSINRAIGECLARAQVKEEQIGLVILTGGSTELPVINDMVKKRFPASSFSVGNKLDSVGLGLAYRADNIF